MLDNFEQTAELLELMDEHLPITAMIPPLLAKLLSEQKSGILIPRTAEISDISYLGDEGGIMCTLSLKGQDLAAHAFVISLTHLRIDARHPLARRIAAYQKRRTKRVAQERRLLSSAVDKGLPEHPREYLIHRP